MLAFLCICAQDCQFLAYKAAPGGAKSPLVLLVAHRWVACHATATAPQIRPSKAKPPEAARDQWLPALSRRDTRAREPPETRRVRREWVTTSGLRRVRGDDGVTATPRGTSSVFKSSFGDLPTDLNCGLKVSSSCALLGIQPQIKEMFWSPIFDH